MVFFMVFLPYLQCCLCENPRGLLQLILLLYFNDHLCGFFLIVCKDIYIILQIIKNILFIIILFIIISFIIISFIIIMK
jgi:hypothetical protein